MRFSQCQRTVALAQRPLSKRNVRLGHGLIRQQQFFEQRVSPGLVFQTGQHALNLEHQHGTHFRRCLFQTLLQYRLGFHQIVVDQHETEVVLGGLFRMRRQFVPQLDRGHRFRRLLGGYRYFRCAPRYARVARLSGDAHGHAVSGFPLAALRRQVGCQQAIQDIARQRNFGQIHHLGIEVIGCGSRSSRCRFGGSRRYALCQHHPREQQGGEGYNQIGSFQWKVPVVFSNG